METPNRGVPSNLFLSRSFTRAEASASLGLPLHVIDALVSSGRLRPESVDGQDLIPAEQFEELFRDTLLALYRALASHEAAVAVREAVFGEETEMEIEEATETDVAAPDSVDAEPLPILTQEVLQQEEAEETAPDLRIAKRFIPRRQIDGTFNRVRFSIVQISSTGLRIRHHEPILAGAEGKVSFALMNPPRSFAVRAHVVWTSIARYGENQGTFWISGLRAIEHADRLAEAMDLLMDTRQLEPDRRAQPRTSSRMLMPPGGVDGATDEEIADVIKVVHRFGADPLEATRWYARAKFALADERVRKSAPSRMRDREEVLGIWEYLDRRIEIAKIAAVISWMRKTRGKPESGVRR